MPIQMRKAWTEGMFILLQINTTAQFPHPIWLWQLTMGFTLCTSSAAPDLVNISPARSHNIKYLHFIGFINPLHNSFSRFSGRTEPSQIERGAG
jgi:hypothetical protein